MKVIPVIVAAPRQKQAVDALVRYCTELDGTEIKVIPAQETGEGYPHRNNSAFKQACREMRGSPFFWCEPDFVPLKKGWLEKLEGEYYASGKEILITSDSNPPHDLVGGIGIYGPNSHFLFPERITHGGFDGWMINHLSPLIARTPLIQHSYGDYNEHGYARDYRFPQDQGVIRKTSLVFHRDKYQDIIKSKLLLDTRFLHTHDMGDIIASLPIIRQMGGGNLVLTRHPKMEEMNGRDLKGDKFESLKSLIQEQSYIKSVTYEDEPKNIDVDFSDFRKVYHPTKNLMNCMAEWVGAGDVDTSPWLTADQNEVSRGKVIVARSPRYNSFNFPWNRISWEYANKIRFLGLDDEHYRFQVMLGRSVERIHVNTFKEMAEVIAGSELFIGNQSSPCWVSMGLGHRMIQETYDQNPDSIIPRDNAQFVRNGNVELPKI